jgi:ParB-like chromosome segregation protein Spo0J
MARLDEITIQKIPVGRINPAPYNPRKDLQPGEPEYEALKRSIETLGYVEPLVWNKKTSTLVAGHQRFKVLQALGAKAIDCRVINVDLETEKALNVTLNSERVRGEWDSELLGRLLADLKTAEYDFTVTGFSEHDLARLLADALPAHAPDEFRSVDETLATDYRCPKCTYEWSGKAK